MSKAEIYFSNKVITIHNVIVTTDSTPLVRVSGYSYVQHRIPIEKFPTREVEDTSPSFFMKIWSYFTGKKIMKTEHILPEGALKTLYMAGRQVYEEVIWNKKEKVSYRVSPDRLLIYES